jgi:Fe-S cluster biogenesis protein NfuA
MSLKSFINASIQGGFNFLPGRGDNQLARLKNLNTIVNYLDATVLNNRAASHVYMINETPGVVGLSLTQFKTSVGVGGGCDCCGCVDGTLADSCEKTPTYSKCSNPGISANRTAPGVYNFHLGIANPSNYGGFAVRFGNVAELGVILNVNRVSATEYIVTAYNTQTGAPMDNVLTNTIVEVLVWG